VPAGEIYQDVFEYTVSDEHGGTDTALVFVDVLGINDAPEAVDDTPTTDEDTTVDIDVLANDEDADEGAALEVFVLEFGATLGSVAIVNNQVRYVPPADFSGTDSFGYTMRDEHGVESSATVTVTVTEVNDLPVAADDEAGTDEDVPVSIDVTANDGDVEDESGELTPVIVDIGGEWIGIAEVVDGEILYTPPANFWGEESIPYYVMDTDGGESNVAMVYVTVAPVNDAPEAVDDLGYEGAEDEPLPIPVLGNDYDVDKDPLWIIDVTEPANGWVEWDGEPLAGRNEIEIPLGDLIYHPNPDYFGPDTFDYTIEDPWGATSTATVTVEILPVNDRPITNEDPGVETNEDTPISIDVTANDFDAEDPPEDLRPILIGETLNGAAAIVDGEVVFTPAENFNGEGAGFWYAAVDTEGAESTLAMWVDVFVVPVNDAPDAVDDEAETLEDEPVLIWVTDNDGDVDGDFFWISDVVQPANGFVEWGEGPGLQQIQNVVEGEPLLYWPSEDYFGPDQFSYTITDEWGAEATATVYVAVLPVNDLPEPVDDLGNVTDEDTPLSIDVTANDFDVEDLPGDLTPILSEGPSNGDLAVVDGEIVYTPDPDFFGFDGFWYYVEDSDEGISKWDAWVEVEVLPVNDDPVAVDDEAATDEDTSVWLFVLENDSPPWVDEGDSISIAGWTDPANGTVALAEGPLADIEAIGPQELVYTPDPDYFGPDQFDYTIVDEWGAEATATVYLAVLPINDLPTAADDEAATDEDVPVTIDVTGNDSDVEDAGADLTPVVETGPSSGSAEVVDGEIVYTPGEDFNGSDSFTYFVRDTDGGESTAATVTVDVLAVNDDPIAKDDAGEGFRMRSDESSFVTASVLDNDYDVDEDALSVVGIDIDGTAGTVIPGPGGTFLYENTGGLGEGATDSWLYRVIDGNGGEQWARVTISINWMPVAQDDLIEASENEGVTLGSVLENDEDGDGDDLTVTPVDEVLSDGAWTIGRIVVDAFGDYTLTLDEGLDALAQGQLVEAAFSYEIDDGFGGVDTADVLVVVIGANDAPVAVDDEFFAFGDLPEYLGNLLEDNGFGPDTDGDVADVLTVSEVDGVPFTGQYVFDVIAFGEIPSGQVIVASNGDVYYEPAFVFPPDDVLDTPGSFNYTVSDGFSTDSATVWIDVLLPF
jgi:hypothetical protein